MSFDTVLVANRGAIACRVIRTLKRMGIRSVAVFSDADEASLHVAEADVAVRIGPGPATQSYLNIARILAAARETGAQAIHPGYGFLSENADFAEACAAQGITFIGRRRRICGRSDSSTALARLLRNKVFRLRREPACSPTPTRRSKRQSGSVIR